MFIRYVLLMVLFGSRLSLGLTEPIHVQMQAGETRILTLKIRQDVLVSRRGVIDIKSLGQDHWNITALHAGFVIISEGKPEDPNEIRVHVHVQTKTNARTSVREIFPIPESICSLPDIHCQYHSISGRTESYELWRETHRLCAQNVCINNLELHGLGLSQWTDILRAKVANHFPYTILRDGTVEILSDCSNAQSLEKLIDLLTQSGLSQEVVFLSCGIHHQAQRYQLQMRNVLIDRSQSSRLGISGNLLRSADGICRNPQNIIKKMDALIHKQRAKILGQPSIQTLAEREIQIESGSELQTEYAQDDPKERKTVWKKIGLSLTAKIHTLTRERVTLNYDLQVRSRIPGISDAITSNTISGEAEFRLGERTLAGTIDLEHVDVSNESLPFFSKIPIIGPLLRFKESAKQKVTLALEFLIRES